MNPIDSLKLKIALRNANGYVINDDGSVSFEYDEFNDSVIYLDDIVEVFDLDKNNIEIPFVIKEINNTFRIYKSIKRNKTPMCLKSFKNFPEVINGDIDYNKCGLYVDEAISVASLNGLKKVIGDVEVWLENFENEYEIKDDVLIDYPDLKITKDLILLNRYGILERDIEFNDKF
jgi:hypothetical protein